jgi:hypothetical protein
MMNKPRAPRSPQAQAARLVGIHGAGVSLPAASFSENNR